MKFQTLVANIIKNFLEVKSDRMGSDKKNLESGSADIGSLNSYRNVRPPFMMSIVMIWQ